MKNETYKIELPGSQPYAKLVTYIQDDSAEIGIASRPLVLVCPGGGYEFTSDREAEPLALQFLAMGYHAAVGGARRTCSPSARTCSMAFMSA